jgi:hypothetical protein
MGLTSVRDPRNDDVRPIDRRSRAAAGRPVYVGRPEPSRGLAFRVGDQRIQLVNGNGRRDSTAAPLVYSAQRNGLSWAEYNGGTNANQSSMPGSPW